MWKHLNLEYKAVLNCFTLSGMHLSNFFEFCIGRHEWKAAKRISSGNRMKLVRQQIT